MIIEQEMTVIGFMKLLLIAGVDCYGRVIGHTCSDEQIGDREEQIYRWVHENEPEVGKIEFVVLDDLPLDMPELIQTDPYKGLTIELANEVVRRFKDDV